MLDLNNNDLLEIEGGIDGEAAMKAIGAGVAICTAVSSGAAAAPVVIVGGCIAAGYYTFKTFI